jgi:antitoxin ParD1/3/4
MTSINISLPEDMKNWIEAEAQANQFHNTSEYMRHLVRREQEYKRKLDALREAVRIGRESGLSDRTPEEIFSAAKKRFLKDKD